MVMEHPTSVRSGSWADPDFVAKRFNYNPETDIWLGRDPRNFDTQIGYSGKDRHVFVCAGSGGGKGRSLVINNLLNWRGSIVSIDPKGENASVCAARRANGDKYCEGLGQKTFVLDPYGISKVPDELRASCNLLDALDTTRGDLLSQCSTLADGLRLSKEGGESESWSKDATDITALIIAHVKTTNSLADEHKHMVMVRDLICEGLQASVDRTILKNKKIKARAKREGKEIGSEPYLKLEIEHDPFELLFEAMLENNANGGAIRKRARRLLGLMKSNQRQFGSLLQNAFSETNFLDDTDIHEQLMARPESGRNLKISDLMDDENGISIFICLPDNPDHPAVRWQKGLIALISSYMKRNQKMPATGKQVLMVLDEFASMGKMDDIIHGMTTIRGAGVKLFVIVTSINRMKKLYGEEWYELLSGSSIKIYFQIDDPATGKHIEEDVGQVQVTITTNSTNFSDMENWSDTETEGETFSKGSSFARGETEGTSETDSTSDTHTHNMSLSSTEADTWNQSHAENQSETKGKSNTRGTTSNSSWQKNSSSSRGGSKGLSYSEGESENDSHTKNGMGLLDPWIKSTNSGRSKSKNAGKNVGESWNKSESSGRSGSISFSDTESENSSASSGNTQTKGVGGSSSKTTQEGYSNAHTTGRSTSRNSSLSSTYTENENYAQNFQSSRARGGSKTIGGGTQETIHVRPLITYDEMNLLLCLVDEEKDYPTYPGFALVRISGTPPFIVRRSNYDQDPAFEGLFTPHYEHIDNYLPASQQRLLGGQYTDDHFLPIRLPKPILEAAFSVDVNLLKISDEWFNKGDPLFTYFAPLASVNKNWFKEASKEYEYEYEYEYFDTEKPFKIKRESLEQRSKIPPHKSLVTVNAPAIGKVIDYAENPAFKEDGDILLIRLERPISDNEKEVLEKSLFFGVLDFLKAKGVAQYELNRMREEINLRYKNGWKKYKKKREAVKEQERKRIEEQTRINEAIAHEKEELQQSRIRAEKNLLIGNYVSVFVFCFIIFPLIFIGGHIWYVVDDPSRVKGEAIYETVHKNSNDSNARNCENYEITRNHVLGDGYNYNCTQIKKIDFNVPENTKSLIFWAIVNSLFWGVIVCKIFVFGEGKNTHKYPENDGEELHKELFWEGIKSHVTDRRYMLGFVPLMLIAGLVIYGWSFTYDDILKGVVDKIMN